MRCYDLYAADGLLPGAVVALREYRLILAGQQALTAAVTPPEMQSSCDLANNVFLPVRHLEHGFPVRLTDMTADDGTGGLPGFDTADMLRCRRSTAADVGELRGIKMIRRVTH
jgi:hypothetical protein